MVVESMFWRLSAWFSVAVSLVFVPQFLIRTMGVIEVPYTQGEDEDEMS